MHKVRLVVRLFLVVRLSNVCGFIAILFPRWGRPEIARDAVFRRLAHTEAGDHR